MRRKQILVKRGGALLAFMVLASAAFGNVPAGAQLDESDTLTFTVPIEVHQDVKATIPKIHLFTGRGAGRKDIVKQEKQTIEQGVHVSEWVTLTVSYAVAATMPPPSTIVAPADCDEGDTSAVGINLSGLSADASVSLTLTLPDGSSVPTTVPAAAEGLDVGLCLGM